MTANRIRCIQDIDRVLDRSRPVITLFSGGLDSSHLLKLLRDIGSGDVTALVVNIGDDINEKALASRAASLGARMVTVDARLRFAEEFVLPAIQAQACYQGIYPISSSLSRPLIASVAMEVARERGAQAILHSAHPYQNTLRRLNGSFELLGFDGAFGTPYEFTPVSRSIEAAELEKEGISELAERSISLDSNLWCREFEAGEIDDPEDFAIPDHLYKWTRAGQSAERSEVTLTYEQGIPVEIDGRPLPLADLISDLNRLAGPYRIGRYVGLEHLDAGRKVLEAREMPAASILLAGYAHLLSATIDSETIREKSHLDMLWVREAVEGRWFGRLRAAAQQFITSVSSGVTGEIRMQFTDGYAAPTSIRVPDPLYIRNREAWESETYRHQYSEAASGDQS